MFLSRPPTWPACLFAWTQFRPGRPRCVPAFQDLGSWALGRTQAATIVDLPWLPVEGWPDTYTVSLRVCWSTALPNYFQACGRGWRSGAGCQLLQSSRPYRWPWAARGSKTKKRSAAPRREGLRHLFGEVFEVPDAQLAAGNRIWRLRDSAGELAPEIKSSP